MDEQGNRRKVSMTLRDLHLLWISIPHLGTFLRVPSFKITRVKSLSSRVFALKVTSRLPIPFEI